MKRILTFNICCLFLFTVSSALAQNTKKDTFLLSGQISNYTSPSVALSYSDKSGKLIKDTAIVKNGTFSFSGTIHKPTRAVITNSLKTRSSQDGNLTELFLEPGNMSISLSPGDFKRAKVTGSITHTEMANLLKQKEATSTSRDSLYALLQKVNENIRNGDKSEALVQQREQLLKKDKVLKAATRNFDYSFITTHPNSYLSPYLMNYYFGSRQLSLDSAELFFNRFTPIVKSSLYGKSIKADIEGRKSSATGAVAPLFAKRGLDGKDISLSSFKGKYVLLDFWAAWCVPCREFTPKLKELYQKYHGKGLEILSISWDDNEEAWRTAVAKDETSIWNNVIAKMSGPDDESMRTKYSVPSIPLIVLIDKDGKIVGRYMASNENGGETELSQKLSEIFK